MARVNIKTYGDVGWNRAAFEKFTSTQYADNTSLLIKMKKFSYLAMDKVLTGKQKECYMKYYVENMKAEAIAKELGVKKCTVYKHIRKANAMLFELGELFLMSCGSTSYTGGIMQIFLKALKSCPPDETAVLRLYYINHLSIFAISREIRLPEGEIAHLLTKGRKRLKVYALGKSELTHLRRNGPYKNNTEKEF